MEVIRVAGPSYGQWEEQPDFREPPPSIEGAADHWNHREDADYYSQPGSLFYLTTPAQQHMGRPRPDAAQGI